MHDELARLDATAQAELVRTGELSCLELVDAAIARIERLEPEIRALATHDFDAARARAADMPGGPQARALAGVPFLIKDLIPYPGLRYALGVRLFETGLPANPSPLSERLDAAGLVVLGKSTTSEMGLLGSTETLLHGITHNPWHRERSAGGSSGGAAAAVAAGMVPMAHASDGGGSIRIPAAMNGLFGFKPGADRVVPAGVENMNGLVVEHCVSWSVRDSALLLSLTERADQPEPVGHIRGPDRERLRIGYYRHTLMGQEPCESALSALQATIALCRELGHELIEVSPPAIDGAVISRGFFTLAGAAMAQVTAIVESRIGRAIGADDLEPFTLALLQWFRQLPADAATLAVQQLAQAGQQMRAFLDQVDVALCPTTPVEVYPLGTLAPTLERELLLQRTETLAGYTPIHNIAGVPAMSVPLFVDGAGLPLGSHFAAGPGGEARLLALAYELEAARPWADRRPTVHAQRATS